jgi:tetratricopeptide (TPR) repeat protein
MAVQRDKVIASAEKLVAKGKIEAAIKEYERLLDDNPNDVNTLNRIGDLWVRINRNEEACRVFGRIADHYGKDGFFLKAIAIYKKINKLDPSRLDVYAKLADLYAKQGLAMEAKGQYQVLADYYLKHGDPANALGAYRKIAELDPNSINVHVKLADLYSQNNQVAEALKEYDRVGKMLLKRGMVDEALQVFRKALKIDPRNVDLAESLVNGLLEAKDYENSIQILETSLEANRGNARLTSLLGRVHISRGDFGAARDVLERGMEANPSEPAIREALAEVYLRQDAPDRALAIVAPLVDNAAARGEGKNAVELLHRILRVDQWHIPTLEKAVQVYTRLHEETNILASMNSLAEAHIGRKNYEAAVNILQDLVEREPENAQHKEKLAFVRQQMGIGAGTAAPAPAPPTPKPAAAPPAPPRPAPTPVPVEKFSVPSIDIAPAEEIAFDLDAGEALELDMSVESSEPSPEEFTPPPPVPELESAPEAEPEGEDLDFITEHMTEAEVFAKYGLTDKAVEHLRAVLDRSPRHTPAFEKLLRVHMDEGDVAQVGTVSAQLFTLLRDSGEFEAAAALEQELTNRGFPVAVPVEAPSAPVSPAASREPAEPSIPDFAAAISQAEPEFSAESLQPAPEEEFSIDLSELQETDEPEVELEVEELTFDTELEMEALEAAAEPEVEPLPEETLIELEGEFELPPAAPIEEPQIAIAPEPEPIPEPIPEPEIAMPEFTGLDSGIAEEIDFGEAPSLEPDFAAPLDLGLDEPPIEELGEVDFYIEQELLEEAEEKLSLLVTRFPDHPEVVERQAKLAEARSSATPFAPPPAAAPAPRGFSADDIENELLSAIPDEDEDLGIIPPPAAASARAAAPPLAANVDESSLFADEDNFFDLAAELEQELVEEQEETVTLSEEEQSLEDIFREFKKGVEQQLDSEDYDTHYNLGIAYKEMGLIDEAIGEFQLASKDPKRMIECCSMLGLCFLEKGMPQLAIKWYRKGLESPEISDDEHLGLLYDLGSAYLEVGDTGNAQKAFMEIYGVNSNYRDIVDRIKQVEDVQS